MAAESSQRPQRLKGCYDLVPIDRFIFGTGAARMKKTRRPGRTAGSIFNSEAPPMRGVDMN
jgi:hypothetical protein